MARPDNQVRTDLFTIATELVNDQYEKQVEVLKNDAEIVGLTGTYTAPVDTRATDAQSITRDLFTFYSIKGGDDMLEAIKQGYTMADQTYQDKVAQLRFNAIKMDATDTEVLSRSKYVLPTDSRLDDLKTYANQFYTLLTLG